MAAAAAAGALALLPPFLYFPSDHNVKLLRWAQSQIDAEARASMGAQRAGAILPNVSAHLRRSLERMRELNDWLARVEESTIGPRPSLAPPLVPQRGRIMDAPTQARQAYPIVSSLCFIAESGRAYIVVKHVAQTLYGSVFKCLLGSMRSDGVIRPVEPVVVVAIKTYDAIRARGHVTRTGVRVDDDIWEELAMLTYFSAFPHPCVLPLLCVAEANYQCPLLLADTEKPFFFSIYPSADMDLFDYLMARLAEKDRQKQAEYQTGKTLSDLEHQVFPEEELRNITFGMAAALNFVHSAGIAHLDVSLENFMMCDGRVVIIDFGMAYELTATGEVSNTGEQVWHRIPYMNKGKEFYKAPEVSNETSLTNDALAIDAWALAASMFTLATGNAPFHDSQGKFHASRFVEIVRSMFNPRGNLEGFLQSQNYILPRDFVNALQCMFENDPTKRMGVKELLRHPWLNGITLR